MNVRYRRVSLIAVAITFLAAGCASVQPASQVGLAQRVETDITVAALPAVDLAGLYVALDDGFFAQQGLHVTIKPVASSAAIISAQLDGQIQIGAGSYVPYVLAEAAGSRFRILAEASTLLPDTRVLVVPRNSAITTINGLIGKKIGVNGTNSIGTLLISAVLEEYGISPKKVDIVTDSAGFPAMPGALHAGAWSAAFLAEPYVTIAEEEYGEQEFLDLDQGAVADFPIDGYMATSAWADRHPATVAAFARAVQEGQAIADTNRLAVEEAMDRADTLNPEVTAVMALPDFPTGPVNELRMQRIAEAMLDCGMLGAAYAAEIEQGTLMRSMVDS
jgi:NitT/TauT family transport system substrate-binding protein